ncbi:MAG: type transport system permease protein [Actinomycetota bacterium]|jgi:ABC-2 type transport system permease protein
MIRLRSLRAVVRHELAIARDHTIDFVIMFFIPIVVMAFFKPAAGIILRAQGMPLASGAEQVVPGMAVMFGLFVVGLVCFSAYREHGYATWDRLRVSGPGPTQIMLTKALIPLGIILLQLTALTIFGRAFLGLRVHGSVIAVASVIGSTAICYVCIGLALSAFCRSSQQVSILANLLNVLMGMLGGAFLPTGVLPKWAQHLAPATPTYWAMQGLRPQFLAGSTEQGAWIRATCVLLAIATVTLAAWRLRFRPEERKQHW